MSWWQKRRWRETNKKDIKDKKLIKLTIVEGEDNVFLSLGITEKLELSQTGVLGYKWMKGDFNPYILGNIWSFFKQ